MQAVINVAIAPLTTNPALWAQNPQQSRLVDELLLGMPVEITGEAEQHMVPVRTFYGYTGWVAQDALLAGPKAEEWLVQPQMVVIARWADVLAEPRVQGACVAVGLPLGARVAVQGEPEDGWQAVTLPDGRTGSNSCFTKLRLRYFLRKRLLFSCADTILDQHSKTSRMNEIFFIMQ